MTFQNYRTVEGDTLSEIAKRAYGDPRLYGELAKYNGIVNPELIHQGKIIRLPQTLAGKQRIANGKAASVPPSPPRPTNGQHRTKGEGKPPKVSPNVHAVVAHASDEQILLWLLNGRLHVGQSTKNNHKGLPQLSVDEFKEFMTAVEQEAYNRRFPQRFPKLYSDERGPAPGTEPRDANGNRLTRSQRKAIADKYRTEKK